jgi:glutathione S-transferase
MASSPPPTTTAPLLLAQFRPAWSAQAYLRLARVAHVVENWSTPFALAAGELPTLRTPCAIVPEEEVLRHLAEHYVDLDALCCLNQGERAQALAFESLLRNELGAALEWSRWGDEAHFARVTRPRLLRVMPFPLNRAWVAYRRRAVLYGLRHGPQKVSSEAGARRAAQAGYAALSALLGDRVWVLGKGPSSLDCVLFGHLMDALREPVAALILRRHGNLASYCQRLQRELFDEAPAELARLCTMPTSNLFLEGEGFNAVYGSHAALDLSSWGADGDGAPAPESGEEAARRAARESESADTRTALMVAGSVVLAYLVFSSNLVSFKVDSSGGFAGGDEDEDGDEDSED